MPQELEHTIRERAYLLWVADGCRDGKSEQHWLAAEREVLAAFAATQRRSADRAGNATLCHGDGSRRASEQQRGASATDGAAWLSSCPANH